MLQRNCGEFGCNINEWTHPGQTISNKQQDCYKCDEQIMNRIPASQSCPKSWMSSPVNAQTLRSVNPCNPQSKVTPNGGFNTLGARVQGGIKRPDYYNVNGGEFNIMEGGSDFRPMPTDPNSPVRKGYNGWNNGSFYSMGKRVSRVHPADLMGQPRVIGSTYWDAWSETYKIDDGRPRGIDPDTGKRLCSGRCKKSRGFWGWLTRSGSRQSCSCNKGGKECVCDGCMGGADC